MKKCVSGMVFFLMVFLAGSLVLAAVTETFDIWPGLAPREKERGEMKECEPGTASELTNPQLVYFAPKEKKCDSAILIVSGGSYQRNIYCYAFLNAEYWNSQGMTAFALLYRVPRPTDGSPIYQSAWEDAQRAVRLIRANAKKYGIDPEKIGIQGFSAGGNLALQIALNSQTSAYEPVDEIDKTPCHVNFAIPIYPAYVLDDGETGQNVRKGENAEILNCFKFEDKTPPLCMIHGDADVYSPLGSVEIYREMHRRGIPCELHLFAEAPHGFMAWTDRPNARTWQDRCADWLRTLKFLPK